MKNFIYLKLNDLIEIRRLDEPCRILVIMTEKS